ncbi:hypothetical protein CC86DRAFT_450891 [Ophiobolus disseminans]|uniref:Nephrocystin 3-like N-terminal domain-containing protein n=1 Tax=Ophiobolus disseminans TaxID=1469910 RepID=A0A6A7AIN4_9PLEO|nr:hypothetical protein CC86DRAFT_450891 [Ophiobolus disseminans]
MSTAVKVKQDGDDFQPRLPRRTTTNLSVDFIEQKISLAEHSRYIDDIDRFVAVQEAPSHDERMTSIWKDASAETAKLETAIQLLREKSRPKGAKTDVETPAFTWKQTVAEINTALESYKNSAFVRICDKSEMFEQWLALLPNDSYASAISGAFTMSVKAARGLSGVNKSIYEALASIPDVLDHAGTYVAIYRAGASTALVRKTADLCKSIVKTLRLIIEFITKGSLKRFTGAVLKGDHYQQKLKESIEEMKLQADNVRSEAGVCAQMRLAEVDRKADVREIKADMRSKQERLDHMAAKEELSLQMAAIPGATAEQVVNLLLRSIQSLPTYNRRTGGPLQTSGLLSLLNVEEVDADAAPENNEGVTVKSLLAALDCDPELLKKDLKYCLNLGFSETPDFQDRAAWVLKAPAMSNFMSGDTGSKLLLVHGNDDATQFISPMSYVCAKVSDLMSVSDEVIHLTYFCSRHMDDWRDPRANAQGLLAHLTAQLLNQLESRKRRKFSPDLSSLKDEDSSRIEGSSLSTTWHAFETIIKQLPKNTVVFCFIDSLSAYENSSRRPKTGALMKKICRLIKTLKGASLRCMVTYSGRSNYSDTWGVEFDRRKAIKLEVPESV